MLSLMMNKMIKKMILTMLAVFVFCISTVSVNAAQMEEGTAEETEAESNDQEHTPLTFEIAIYTYEMLPEATQEDMPTGFVLGDWEYNGVPVKAGFTENSDMICVMAEDWETGYKYRFIYDPVHDMFVPYFGTEIKNGYIYTIPMYEEAEVPYGFREAYFLIQTVPMFTYMREDAELTQEEIAVGSLSEDNYLVFLMMDENGKEVHYTYDLVDRTYQRSLLQKKDAEKVTELNETIDKLSEDIGILNANHAERMNGRLTIIGILIAAVIIMAGVIVNLLFTISKLKKEGVFEAEDEDEDEEEDEDEAPNGRGGIIGLFRKKSYDEDDEEEDPEEDFDEEEEPQPKKTVKTVPAKSVSKIVDEDDELEIVDLDLDDL